MTISPAPITTLTFRAGMVEASAWPEGLPPPFGARRIAAPPRPAALQAPGRLRWRLRQSLEAAGAAFHDGIADPPPCLPAIGTRLIATTTSDRGAQPALESLRLAGYRGLLYGVPELMRVAIVVALARSLNQRALVAVIDTAAGDRWHRLAGAQSALMEVHTFARLSREVHWRGGQQDLLVVDGPDAVPHSVAATVCDASAALARVGFVDRFDTATVERLTPGLGSLVYIADPHHDDRSIAEPDENRLIRLELRVPLPADRQQRYDEAWHTFLAAYDRFLASRGGAGFGAFLSQARSDPTQRPAVLAWHEAVRLAAWHPGKAALLAELLQQHEHERVLVFTPDRESAYEIAGAHLVPAVTSQLPRGERAALLGAFASGELRVLAGPRLLETGVEQGRADVAILVGGGHGAAQRRRRLKRVRPHGLAYELTSLDTLEIGRASRWRAGDADAAAAIHHD